VPLILHQRVQPSNGEVQNGYAGTRSLPLLPLWAREREAVSELLKENSWFGLHPVELDLLCVGADPLLERLVNRFVLSNAPWRMVGALVGTPEDALAAEFESWFWFYELGGWWVGTQGPHWVLWSGVEFRIVRPHVEVVSSQVLLPRFLKRALYTRWIPFEVEICFCDWCVLWRLVPELEIVSPILVDNILVSLVLLRVQRNELWLRLWSVVVAVVPKIDWPMEVLPLVKGRPIRKRFRHRYGLVIRSCIVYPSVLVFPNHKAALLHSKSYFSSVLISSLPNWERRSRKTAMICTHSRVVGVAKVEMRL